MMLKFSKILCLVASIALPSLGKAQVPVFVVTPEESVQTTIPTGIIIAFENLAALMEDWCSTLIWYLAK